MTQQEITQNNILIAQFMGGKLPDETQIRMRSNEIWLPYHGICRRDTVEIGNGKTLKYHCSWDWLMPVVESIEGLGASVIIGRFFCEIKYIDPLNTEKHFEIRIASGVKINAVNGAITEFIQWHNQNTK